MRSSSWRQRFFHSTHTASLLLCGKCFYRNSHAWLGKKQRSNVDDDNDGREILRQLLNHVICLLKAHFASLCVTWAWRMCWSEEGRCRNCTKTSSDPKRCACCKSHEEEPCLLTLYIEHRFDKLFSIKNWRRKRQEKKANASGKKWKEFEASRNQGKEGFVSWIQILFTLIV